jgi:hypothetical protein
MSGMLILFLNRWLEFSHERLTTECQRMVRPHRRHGPGHLPLSRSNASALPERVSGLLACHFRSRNLPSVFSAQIIRWVCTTRKNPGLSRRSNSRRASVTDWSPFKWQTVIHFLLRHCSIVKNPCAINSNLIRF